MILIMKEKNFSRLQQSYYYSIAQRKFGSLNLVTAQLFTKYKWADLVAHFSQSFSLLLFHVTLFLCLHLWTIRLFLNNYSDDVENNAGNIESSGVKVSVLNLIENSRRLNRGERQSS